jgi:hypothetical protein
MFSTLRNRFGIPGVISVIALVFAMLGGAYAASNDGGGGKATASAKAKRGPRGPKGATGPAGPAGAQGPAGPAGPVGANGANGEKGATGTNGTSVTVTNEASNPSAPCGIPGGIKVKSANPDAFVCNGEDGAPGIDGSPWTLDGTLPSGATETGVWSFSGIKNTEPPSSYPLFGALSSISFTIPLAAPLDSGHVVFVPTPAAAENPDPTHCAGSAASPSAVSGYLCVYEQTSGGLSNPLVLAPNSLQKGTGKTGTLVVYPSVSSELAPFAYGTWAVTG